MLKRFLLASAMLFVPLTTFAQNATTQVNGAILNGTPTTILTPWVPNGDGTYSQKVSATSGGGSNAAAGPVNTTAPASASYTGFLSGANIVPVSATNPLPISGTISATTTANATAAAPTYTSGSNPLSVDFAGNLRVAGAFYQATQPVSAAALPLPTGAATSALQTTINATLGTPFQAGGSVGITGTPAFKVSDTAGNGITSTLLAGKQRLDVTLAAGGAPGATASIVADQVGGVDGGGLLRALSVDTAGRVNVQGGNATAVKTDGSAVTQPVSGTVAVTGAYQATQPVSIATMPSTPVTGTFYQATQPVSLAALPALAVGANVIGGVTQSGLWTVGGALLMPTATFTTTALTTAWTSNQLIANNATAGSVVPLTLANAVRVAGGTGSIRRAQIQVASDTGFAGQSLVLALYTVSPTFANGDRATWLTSFSGFIGQIAVTLSQHFSDYEQGIGVPVNGSELNFACAGGSTTIYGVVVSAGTLTPQAASKAIIASLEILAN